ncbi:MAG TPA: OB-fold domain-containing protein [Novosphingobium sp.]|nr:OB-fold domain-containing protein [Novosphingobium sp.]
MTYSPVSATRQRPIVNELNAHFWKGGKDGKLHIGQCGACKHWIHPYALRCPKCHSADVAPQPVSGRGTVVGFSVNHQAWAPDLKLPYVVALVELEEQADIRLLTNMPRTPIEQVRIGLPVTVSFEQHGDLFYPEFDAAAGEV